MTDTKDLVACPQCRGSGFVQQPGSAQQARSKCPTCNGAGQVTRATAERFKKAS